MTDLHTHILPGMDDGAPSADISLEMLRMEREQGIRTAVMTPHFYRDRETPGRFLQRRQKAEAVLREKLDTIPEEERTSLPQLVMGAEVAWWPDIAEWEELEALCIGDTKNLLLELPFVPWNGRMINLIYDFIGKTGITPVIAHLDRYLKTQRPEYIREILALGVPVQISGDILLMCMHRAGALRLLGGHGERIIASDCHSASRRPPNMGEAMSVVRRKLGDLRAEELLRCAEELAGEE